MELKPMEINSEHESFRAAQLSNYTDDPEVYFLKQTMGKSWNKSDSVLKKFLEDTAKMSADERAKQLESNVEIHKVHNEVAADGQCQVEEGKTIFHFVTFVCVNGQLWELDGKMNFPVNHGATNEDSFIMDASKVCRQFVEREKEEVHFCAVAFCKI